jgi:hypothetical protein
MKCKEVQPELLDFADNRVDEFTRDEIDKHLKTCEKCRDDLKELRTLAKTITDARDAEPSPALRENFNTMLQSELNILATANILKDDPSRNHFTRRISLPVWRIAASLILLLTGIGIGVWIGNGLNKTSNGQMSELRKEVKGMKEALMFTLLDEESPSQRIKAVNYAEEMPNPNQDVIRALINTLNHDKNVNVRLASLYSLSRFSNQPAVVDSLVSSLSGQSEPIIQILLINMLAEKKETRAIKPIQDILSNQKTLKEVKDIARKGLSNL